MKRSISRSVWITSACAAVSALALTVSLSGAPAIAEPVPTPSVDTVPTAEQDAERWFDEDGNMNLPEWNELLNEGQPLGEALARFKSDFPLVYNYRAVDYENGVLELRYNETASDDDVRGFLAAVDELPSAEGLTITTKPQAFSLTTSESLLQGMFDEREHWKQVLGSPMWSVYANKETGVVHIAIDEAAIESAEAAVQEIDGVPVVLEAYTHQDDPDVGPQLSRFYDYSP